MMISLNHEKPSETHSVTHLHQPGCLLIYDRRSQTIGHQPQSVNSKHAVNKINSQHSILCTSIFIY